MSKPNKRDKIDLLLKLSIAVMFIVGFLIFMYPFVVDSINWNGNTFFDKNYKVL